MKNILITGANGFVGSTLSAVLLKKGYVVRAAVRDKSRTLSLPKGAEPCVIGEITAETDWKAALDGIDTIVHLAARVHIMKDTATDPLSEFRKVNTDGTSRLATTAARAGVKKMVYLSTIKVNGEDSRLKAFTEKDEECPSDPYAVSKWETEKVLIKISDTTGLEVVVLRTPLVYGPKVKGNFLRLMDLVSKGIPLPLGGIENQRSFIYVGNLADAIMRCIEHPCVKNELFLVSDGRDVSISELIRMIASSMGKRARLITIPPFLLKNIAKVIGGGAEISRLTGTLRVDNGKIRKALAWEPPYSLDDGISETVRWFKEGEK